MRPLLYLIYLWLKSFFTIPKSPPPTKRRPLTCGASYRVLDDPTPETERLVKSWLDWFERATVRWGGAISVDWRISGGQVIFHIKGKNRNYLPSFQRWFGGQQVGSKLLYSLALPQAI